VKSTVWLQSALFFNPQKGNDMEAVAIGDRAIGPGHPTYIVAEIGINHNGNIEIAKRLIESAKNAGCDAVKFQKRTVDTVYTPEELATPRESPFGTTNGELKHGLEFDQSAYEELDGYCRQKSITWFASCWDEASFDFIHQLNPPCYKIASASLTDDHLLKYHRRAAAPIILSTGMSTLDQIDHAVDVLGKQNLAIMHTTSTYPSQPHELNLRVIPQLMQRYEIPIGYSGHEVGLSTTVGAVALGACIVERHITLDRAMWGSDQAASIEPHGFARMVKDIRAIEVALGDGVKHVYPSELPVLRKLRRKG
jgi:N-acetylneuraminate synthase